MSKIEAVVVAAGLSSRASGWKPGFKIGGLTVIERCILGMVPFCSRIIVVGGLRFDCLKELLPKQKYPMVELVYNRDYRKGMLTSVREGFRRVRTDRFFFIPGDYPLVSTRVYQALLQVEAEVVIPSFEGVTGHPVLFETYIAKELLLMPQCPSLREFIQICNTCIVEVNDPGVLMDIDMPEDYLEAVRYYDSRNSLGEFVK